MFLLCCADYVVSLGPLERRSATQSKTWPDRPICGIERSGTERICSMASSHETQVFWGYWKLTERTNHTAALYRKMSGGRTCQKRTPYTWWPILVNGETNEHGTCSEAFPVRKGPQVYDGTAYSVARLVNLAHAQKHTLAFSAEPWETNWFGENVAWNNVPWSSLVISALENFHSTPKGEPVVLSLQYYYSWQ